MLSELPQKEQFKKQQKQLVIWLVIKFQIKLQKSQEVHHRIIQKRLKNEHDKEITKERYISPEGRQKIIDDLRLI